MKYNRDYGFVTGFLLGGIAGAATALLMAPASGLKTRDQIRSEGKKLRIRGEEFGNDRMKQAREMVKQGQKQMAVAQERTRHAIKGQRDYLNEVVDAGKLAAIQRKEELLHRFEDAKAKVSD